MDNLTPEQIAEKKRWDALTPAQKGAETKAKKAAEKAKAAAEKAKAKATPAPPADNPPADKGELTEHEKRADAEAEKARAKAAEEAKPKAKDGFLNPFTTGVTYADFVKAIPNGKTVAEYCKGKLTKDEINWISEEVEHFKKNQQK